MILETRDTKTLTTHTDPMLQYVQYNID